MKKEGVPEGVGLLERLSKEELIEIIVDDARNWLAHDGLWFEAVESAHGMEAAMEAGREAWRRFTVIEALKDNEAAADGAGRGDRGPDPVLTASSLFPDQQPGDR